MHAPSLHIILYQGHTDSIPSLDIFRKCKSFSLKITCLIEDSVAGSHFLDSLKPLLERAEIMDLKILRHDPASDWHMAANSALSADDAEYIFFYSSSIFLPPGLFESLHARLLESSKCAGVNPVLYARRELGKDIIDFLGVVCDVRRHLHFLYWGISARNLLAKQIRHFQLAHPGALLLRSEDFKSINGFPVDAGSLAFYILCLRLLRSRPGGFITDTSSVAYQYDRFYAYRFCSLWNSVLERGRVRAIELKPDYPDFAISDGLEYKIDPWLNEFASPYEISGSPGTKKEGEWLERPSPASFTDLLSHLSPASSRELLLHSRAYPSLFPHVFLYYHEQCTFLNTEAQAKSLLELTGMTENWEKKARRFHYGLLRPGMRLLRDISFYDASLDRCPCQYDAWIEMKEGFEDMRPGAEWPAIAVMMPVFDPDPDFLRQAIDSVLQQSYPNWQLCICDDCSMNSQVRDLLASFAAKDERILITCHSSNRHISEATNSALALASSPFVTFLDHDDLLAKEALGTMARAIAENPEKCFLYSDEDHIDIHNIRRTPVFRHEFDREADLSGHLFVYRTDLIRSAGGMRKGYEGSQDLDLCLRIVERLEDFEILHVPYILYHWRIHPGSASAAISSKPYALEATKKALADACQRRGIAADIMPAGRNNFYKIKRRLTENISCALVHILDNSSDLDSLRQNDSKWKFAASLQVSRYLLLKNGVSKEKKLGDCKFISGDWKNWSEAFNLMARIIEEDLAIFIYGDLVPAFGCDLEGLLAEAVRDDISMVGGLIWRKGSLENGGWYPDISGEPFPLLKGFSRGDMKSCDWGRFLLSRRVLAPDYKCCAFRKEIFKMKPFLKEDMGDYGLLDLAMRYLKSGLYPVCSPWGQFEDQGYVAIDSGIGKERFLESWRREVHSSGLRNANLKAAPDNGWALIL